MSKTFHIWISKKNPNKLLLAQKKHAKDLALKKKRQAVIGEETVELDEEHGQGNGPIGKSGIRGTI